ncbi:MAG: sulfatase-like hydrolase/transferase [Rikenellaceae bacterium]
MKKILLTSLLAPTTMAVQAAPSQPDVLFIFLDDMTYNGIRALGNDQVITPNLDKIVNQGVRFTNAYNMGAWNGAVSMASRTQLMTGLGVWRSFEQQKNDKYKSLVDDNKLWPQVMKGAGYQTYHTGKWHMAHVNPAKIFDEVEAVRPGMPEDNYKTTRVGYSRPLSKDDNAWQPWDKSMGGYWQGGKHWSEVQADLAIGYIERNKRSEKPLFISCAFNAPHDPRQSPKEYVDMYPVDQITIPKSFQAQHPYMVEMECDQTLRDEDLAPFPRTEYAVQKHRQEYYAIITHLDDQIGRLMEALKKSGRADNTLIVLSADNGLAMGNHGLLGKQSMYEHSMKVPLVIGGCGLPKGQQRKQLVYLQDLVPTIYEATGIERPEAMEFKSLLPLVKSGKAEAVRKVVYGAYINRQRMVRDNRYKIYFIPDAKKFYLFDLANDPLEMNDLSQAPQSKEIIKRMANKYRKEAQAVGDGFDIIALYPDVFNL